MAHHALARQWRPSTFADVVGQSHVVTALQNALEHQRLHHAYLFTGTRGVGKTTLARLIAKALNCEQGIAREPCNVCDTCQLIDQGRCLDVMEVDAASRTKVEDTRELLENVAYRPVNARYKIYLIDEVHMLSQHSFNALLKTLEEPPEHVKFLLATTDPQKIPTTVLSRCLQFRLTAIAEDAIVGQLQRILDKEGLSYEQDMLVLLAQAGQGSLRDSLSILDQAIALSEGSLSSDTLQQLLGTLSHHQLAQLLQACSDKQGKAVVSLCQQAFTSGVQPRQALEQLLDIMHALYLAAQVPDLASQDHPHAAWIQAQLQRSQLTQLEQAYQGLLQSYQQLALHPHRHRGFELALIRLMHDLNRDPMPAQPKVSAKQATSRPEVAPQPTKPNKPSQRSEQKTVSPTTSITADTWVTCVSRLGLTGMTKAVAQHSSFLKLEGSVLTLGFLSTHMPMVNDRHIQRIEQALAQQGYGTLRLRIQASDQAQQPNVQEQLQSQAQEQRKQRLAQAETHPAVAHAKDVFEAKITDIHTTEDTPHDTST